MLDQSSLIGFVAVTDTNRAMHFYGDALGLTVVQCDDESCVLDANGSTLRLTKVLNKPEVPYTVAGWAVDDIEATVEQLSQNGVSFQRYEGIEQDSLGVWTTPDGSRVAWFLDPDNNVLSITQFQP